MTGLQRAMLIVFAMMVGLGIKCVLEADPVEVDCMCDCEPEPQPTEYKWATVIL